MVWRILAAVLAVEFVDEVVDGVGGAALPVIRNELSLSYAQVGLLLGAPAFVSSVVEPFLGIAADVWRRRVIVLGGGAAFVVALAMVAAAPGFAVLLGAFVLFYPASGAFVSLTQASTMDADPSRREQNMARWTLSGTAGNVAGPLLLAGAVAAGAGWRGAYASAAAVGVLALAAMSRFPFARRSSGGHTSMRAGIADALRDVRRGAVLRWLLLLELSDLMLDTLGAFLALYLVEVGGLSVARAALVVAARSGAMLAGEAAVVWLLERVRGLAIVRVTVVAAGVMYTVMLASSDPVAKSAAAVALGLVVAGWYAILRAGLYAEVPERSGTTVTLTNLAGLVWSVVPILLGAVAARHGLQAAMWLLLAGPVGMLAGLPREV